MIRAVLKIGRVQQCQLVMLSLLVSVMLVLMILLLIISFVLVSMSWTSSAVPLKVIPLLPSLFGLNFVLVQMLLARRLSLSPGTLLDVPGLSDTRRIWTRSSARRPLKSRPRRPAWFFDFSVYF